MGASAKASPKSKAKSKPGKKPKKVGSSHGSEPGVNTAGSPTLTNAQLQEQLAALTVKLADAEANVKDLTMPKKKGETSVAFDDDKRSKYAEHPAQVEDLRANWRMWKRQHLEWRSQNFNQTTMVLGMLKNLSTEQVELIHSVLEPPLAEHGVEAIYAVLEDNYAGVSVLDAQADFAAYSADTRGTQAMAVWLVKRSVLRNRAIASGMEPDTKSGFTLLAAANLTSDQKSNILKEIDLKRVMTIEMLRANGKDDEADNVPVGAPTYSDISGKLHQLVQHQALDNQQRSTGKTSALATTVARPIGKVNSKSRIKREKTKKKLATLSAIAAEAAAVKKFGYDWTCSKCGNTVWDSKNVCTLGGCGNPRPADGGVRAKSGGGKGAKGTKGKGVAKGGGKGTAARVTKQPCRHFAQNGSCPFGERCHFTHISSTT